MKKTKQVRVWLTWLFGVICFASMMLSYYILSTNKENTALSGLMSLALMTFLLTVGNVVVLITKKASR